jgi:hypothetical protein
VRPLTEKQKAALQRFDDLPRNAMVGIPIAALVSDLSEKTWRENPPIETFFITTHKLGVNVGKLRDLASGLLTTPREARPNRQQRHSGRYASTRRGEEECNGHP